MLSIILLARNARSFLIPCLQSVVGSLNELALGMGQAELILIDNGSDPAMEIPKLFCSVREQVRVAVRVLRFREHQHYVKGVSQGLSVAKGSRILFVSHDMIVPASCIKTLIEAADVHLESGIIRPCSGHMDCAQQFQVQSPLPLRSAADVSDFSRLLAQRFGLSAKASLMLVADAMLVKRSVIERIGVFDTRFVGFMGDLDYGLRAERAGFKLAVAEGAWLYHEGGGFCKDLYATYGEAAAQEAGRGLTQDHADAWKTFREKWNPSLPERFADARMEHFLELREMKTMPFDLHQPLLSLNGAESEWL